MNPLQSGLLVIRTPEGIAFPLTPATPAARLLAVLIDLATVSALGSALSMALLLLFPLAGFDLALAVLILGGFVLNVGYGMALEWFWKGQTLGKRVLGLRVMDEQGLHLSPSQVIIRNLLRFVDILPGLYLVGGACAFLSPKFQRLGDIAANTVVIRMSTPKEPDLDQIMKGKFNSLRDHPHLAARLRQGAPKELAGIALSAILRRDSMDPQSRLELFADISARLKELAAFPQEVTDGLSDEQYVKNAVDILFRA